MRNLRQILWSIINDLSPHNKPYVFTFRWRSKQQPAGHQRGHRLPELHRKVEGGSCRSTVEVPFSSKPNCSSETAAQCFNLKFVSVSTLRSAGTRRATPWSWRWSWRTRIVNAVISTLTESFTGLSGADHQPSITYFTSHPTLTGAFLTEHFKPVGAGTCSAWPAWAWINHTTWWRFRRSSGLQLN